MGDLLPIIIIGAIILFIVYTMMKNQTRMASDPDDRDFRTQGSERPRYDDPEIEGRGGFGRDKDRRRDDDATATYAWMDDEEDLKTRQSERPVPYAADEPEDDPDIDGRGGFGRDKR